MCICMPILRLIINVKDFSPSTDFCFIWMADYLFCLSSVFIGYALLFRSVSTLIFMYGSCMNGVSFAHSLKSDECVRKLKIKLNECLSICIIRKPINQRKPFLMQGAKVIRLNCSQKNRPSTYSLHQRNQE